MVVGKIYEPPTKTKMEQHSPPTTSIKKQPKIIKGKEINMAQDTSLGKRVLDSLKTNGDEVNQIFAPTGETTTFAEIRSRSINVAVELKRRGIGIGDVVSTCSNLQPDICLPLLGTIYVGGIFTPLDPSLSVFDMKNLMSITNPKIIFCELESVDKIETSLAELGKEAEIVVFGKPKKAHHVPFSTFKQPRINEEEFEVVDFKNPHDHVALIMPSSGTTGLPKGVALSHGNLIMSLQIIKDMPIEGLKILNTSTLYWITGVIVILISIEKRFCRILVPKFDADSCLQSLEKYKVTWLLTGVTYFMKMLKHPNATKYDYSSLQTFAVSGAKLSPDQIRMGKELFKNARFNTSYGITETSGNLFDMMSAKPGSIGYVAPGIEVKIVDPKTQEMLGPDQKGELCIKSGIIFYGYYNNQKSTDEVKDKDGWFHTGDLCWYDEDDCFYIEGRIKELFKCRGWQISPDEMEDVLRQHPGVEMAGVIGVSHEEDVARARAYIVKKAGVDITENDIHMHMQERMSPNKQLLGGIVFIDEMPLTPTGKIQKRTLHEMAKMEPTISLDQN